MNDMSLYQKISDKVDDLYNEIEIEEAFGMEGLNSSIIGRMFVSIVDTLGQVCKTAFSNLVNIGKSLKRSELHEFVQSNTLRVNTVDGIPYANKSDVDVDTPANMRGTYRDAVNTLIHVYTKLNAVATTKLCDTSLREISSNLATGNQQVSRQIETAASIIVRTANAAKPAINLTLSAFGGKFTYKRKFSDVFLSNQEWIDVRKDLIDNEHRLQDVSKLADMVTSMEDTLNEIAKFAEGPESSLTRKDLMNMAEIAKSIALILEAYGMASTRHIAIEHNYVLCTNHIYDTCR